MEQLNFLENDMETPQPLEEKMPSKKPKSPAKLITLPAPVLPAPAATAAPSPAGPTRRILQAPCGTSKSMVKALGCPTFFAGQVLQPETLASSEHPLARTGTEFHAYRQAYIDHLQETGRWSDPAWVAGYLEREPLSEDARSVIENDRGLELDPRTIYGTELFLSIDHEGRPLDHEFGRKPGSLSLRAETLASGTIDTLLLDGSTASVLDAKSGWSTNNVTDEEPAYYAGLVLCHFPKVERVIFLWDFSRVHAVRQAEYARHDLAWILTLMRQWHDRKLRIVEQYNAGQRLEVNPLSGNCPYCQLSCPMRPRWDAGELDLGPAQTENDVRRLLQIRHVCDQVSARINAIVSPYFDVHGGPLDLGNEYYAYLRVSDKREYPLPEALEALGLGLIDMDRLPDDARQMVREQQPGYTPRFDVPLSALKLSGLSGPMKTKKSKRRGDAGGVSREGLRDALAPAAKRSAATALCIRKGKPPEEAHLLDQLEESIECQN